VKTIAVTPKEADALYLQPGDILMNEGGDRDKLGRGWVWEGQIDRCIHQNHVFRLRLKIKSVLPRYVSYYANEFGQSYFMDQGKQTTNLASISLTKLSSMPIPIAQPEEMELIVERIEERFADIDAAAQQARRATELLERLDRQTLAKTFRGELVSQDPKDEPASLLLERIWEARAEEAAKKRKGRVYTEDSRSLFEEVDTTPR
jgi:type I restriction enzyme, S subunit